MTLQEVTDRAVSQYVRDLLAQEGGNMRRAALAAGCARSHLYRLCVRYQIPYRREPISKPLAQIPSFASWGAP